MRTLPAPRSWFSADVPRAIRIAAIVLGVSVLVAYAVLAVSAVAANWYFFDARGYWEAGMRLRSGGELYPPLADPDHPFVYRYSPWFGYAWAGLTLLPREVVFIGWGLLLVAASAWLLLQLPRSAVGLLLGLIFAPMLLRVVSQGNVHPLMVAALVWGFQRRSGPIWVAVAASLKLVPVLFAALYIVRREYRRAAWAVVLTALLWAPAAVLGLANYPTGVGGEAFPFGWLTFVVAAAALAALFLVPARYRALAAGLVVTFASPRWIPYNPTYLFVGLTRDADDDRSA